jgi:hypothetical protein
MIPLTIGVAILDDLTPVTSLETDAFLLHLAAFRAAVLISEMRRGGVLALWTTDRLI